MKNIEIELPILDLNTSFVEQMKKISEEALEINESTSQIQILEETYDTIQASFGLLLKMPNSIVEANIDHIAKLQKRKWKTKGIIRIIIEEYDD